MKNDPRLEQEIRQAQSMIKSAEWQSGFQYGEEAARDEFARYNRASVRATYDQIRAYARNDFDLGQVAGYERVLAGEPRYVVAGAPLAKGTKIEVDTSAYRSTHGAEPRGTADWTFLIGKRRQELSDDPALYRPARERGAHKSGVVGLPYGDAKRYAISEARRRGKALVAVAP